MAMYALNSQVVLSQLSIRGGRITFNSLKEGLLGREQEECVWSVEPSGQVSITQEST